MKKLKERVLISTLAEISSPYALQALKELGNTKVDWKKVQKCIENLPKEWKQVLVNLKAVNLNGFVVEFDIYELKRQEEEKIRKELAAEQQRRENLLGDLKKRLKSLKVGEELKYETWYSNEVYIKKNTDGTFCLIKNDPVDFYNKKIKESELISLVS